MRRRLLQADRCRSQRKGWVLFVGSLYHATSSAKLRAHAKTGLTHQSRFRMCSIFLYWLEGVLPHYLSVRWSLPVPSATRVALTSLRLRSCMPPCEERELI